MSSKRTKKRHLKRDRYTGIDYEVLQKKIDEEEITLSEIEKLIDVVTNKNFDYKFKGE